MLSKLIQLLTALPSEPFRNFNNQLFIHTGKRSVYTILRQFHMPYDRSRVWTQRGVVYYS